MLIFNLILKGHVIKILIWKLMLSRTCPFFESLSISNFAFSMFELFSAGGCSKIYLFVLLQKQK